MPLSTSDDGVTTKFPDEKPITLDNFKRGVITLIDQSKIPKNALVEADNIYLTEDGAPTIRPGIDWYGQAVAGTVRTASHTDTTNLLTNPSFEVNTTGYAAFNSGTLSRVTTEHYTGTASLQVVSSGATDSGISATQVTGLAANTSYTFSVYFKAPVGVAVGVQIDTYTTALAYVATRFNQLAGDGNWQRIEVPIPLGATETAVTPQIYVNNNAQTFYLDGLQLEQNPTATAYFDGSLANTVDTDYAWTGTANASTSTRKVYTLTTASIDGFDYFDFNGVIHLVAAVNGSIYRSTNDGDTWTVCTGATYTAGTDVGFNQNAFNQGSPGLYITTGSNIVIYDGSTTLVTYTSLSTPAAPTVAKTGLAATTYTYYYKTALVNKVGFSIASPAASIQTSLTRDSWDNTTNFITVTVAAPVATQERVDIFISEDNINFYYLDSIISSTANPAVTYRDNGSAIVIPSTLAPTGNTTQGPKVASLTNVGSRMYGVRDTDNRYRIWFSSGSYPLGAFSAAYDGGYLDWQPGGKFIPLDVEDYRDKSGAPVATVWCDSADGEGCILQMFLDTATVDGVTVTIPSAYKLAGSRGTNAPGSVVNVLNDYMYYNSQAFYNLGSRAQFLNLLSTDESSANIRNTVKTINASGAHNIASIFYDAKVFFSVPYGSATTNTHTLIYDTEQKAWLPTAFTVGFKKFLRYTDTAGTRRLLAVKPGDNRLSEISDTILGDYGQAFQTSLLTGLYSTNKSRFGFETVSNGFVEFSGPQSTINIDVLGIERKRGYTTVKQVHLNPSTSTTDTGWDTFADDGTPWDDTSDTPSTYAESSVKRYFPIGREMNAVQWHITTFAADARYKLRTLETTGTDTQAGPPKEWRLKT